MIKTLYPLYHGLTRALYIHW